MGKQKLVMSLAILTLFLFSFTLISAMEADNITIVTPVASGSLVGATADFNVTLVTGADSASEKRKQGLDLLEHNHSYRNNFDCLLCNWQ